MHPILSQLRRLFWYVFAWMVLGVALAWVLVELRPVGWNSALLFALPSVQLYGFILTSTYYVCRSLPFRQRTALRVLVVFGSASLLSSIVWVGLSVFWSNILGVIENHPGSVLIDRQFTAFLFIVAVLLYVLSLLANDVFIAFDNIRMVERKQVASQLLARDAELQMLRSQINPHFLFNSLNSISALTSIDATAARSMAIELGSFYRKTLALSTRQEISLGEEIELCEHFLAIEKIRFGEKLQVKWSIESAALSAQVPAMFLQPLLENAIKHGICNLSDGGTIKVKSFIHDVWLHIVIENPLDQESSITPGTATGLKNLIARIQNLYADHARVSWQGIANHFCVEIIIPFEGTTARSANE
jgi:two-component system sensor histidine kinase AlgZ